MKRGLAWPIGITAVLTLTVAANIWVMRVASADPSFAIEPDYYAKAVAWDSTLAQERRNRALGWRVLPSLSAWAPARGAKLEVRVVDAAGAAIRNAEVRVSAFAVARSGARVDTTLTEARETYEAILPILRGGIWELRFDVRRSNDRMTATQRVDVGVAMVHESGSP
jgi:hypothetical protein